MAEEEYLHMAIERTLETDVLVIGGGIAGCCAAIEAKKKGLDVTIVDKGHVGTTGCTYFSGMNFTLFNPAMGSDYNLVMQRIIQDSEYTNDREWTDIIMRESWAAYEMLAAWGVEFPVEEKEGRFYTIYPPFLQARVNGMQVSRPLRPQALKCGVRIIDRVVITDLIKHKGEIVGAVGFPLSCFNTYIFKAKAVIISSGNWALRNSTGDNHEGTGDGQAMAYRAGADLTGGTGGASQAHAAENHSWKAGRAARSVFRYYTDAAGTRIAHGYESDTSIDMVFHEGRGPIYHDLDQATAEDRERMWKRQQGSDAKESARVGYDPRNGGKFRLSGGGGGGIGASLWPTDKFCSTTVPGLFSAGNCCGTRAEWWGGLPASAVTGIRAGKGAAEYALQAEKPQVEEQELARLKQIMFAPAERRGGFDVRWVTQLLINTMTPYYVLVVQHADRLKAALTMVEFFSEQYVPKLMATDSHTLRLAHEVKNMALGSEIALKACLFRTESRAYHYREDYPFRDDPAWLAWTRMREEEGNLKIWKEPIPREWWPDLTLPYKERYPKRFPGEKT
jgi:succinate dehydrogenase/fumarate reductase flavoprotein subunit